METYDDVYDVVMSGRLVVMTHHNGIKRTFFKNENGKARQSINDGVDRAFKSGDDLKIGGDLRVDVS